MHEKYISCRVSVCVCVMNHQQEPLAVFNLELIPASFERSPNKADSALLNELCLLLGAKPKETFERNSTWSCTLLWANMGPFHGRGANKKEARNDAAGKAVDFILGTLAPFRKKLGQPNTTSSVWIPDHMPSIPEPPCLSILFLIDLDSCSTQATKLVHLCRELLLQRVSCQGFASKMYNGSSLPKEIVVERADSVSKSSAAFLIAYRAGIIAVKYRNSSWKPIVWILSRDSGLMAVAQMLEESQFRVYFSNDTNQVMEQQSTLITASRQCEEATRVAENAM